MKDLRKAKTIEDVSRYVQRFARYYADAPKSKYAVQHPTQFGTAHMSSHDTWDLVVKLAKEYDIEDEDVEEEFVLAFEELTNEVYPNNERYEDALRRFWDRARDTKYENPKTRPLHVDA